MKSGNATPSDILGSRPLNQNPHPCLCRAHSARSGGIPRPGGSAPRRGDLHDLARAPPVNLLLPRGPDTSGSKCRTQPKDRVPSGSRSVMVPNSRGAISPRRIAKGGASDGGRGIRRVGAVKGALGRASRPRAANAGTFVMLRDSARSSTGVCPVARPGFSTVWPEIMAACVGSSRVALVFPPRGDGLSGGPLALDGD